jgi:hypothetical protein
MTNSMTLFFAIIICFASYVIHLFVLQDIHPVTMNFVLFKSFDVSSLPFSAILICNAIIYILVGYLLIELNNRSDILRIRPSVLCAFYYLFVILCPELYLYSLANISLLALIVSLFFLFSSYQCYNSSSYLFHAFAVLSIGTLFFPQLMYLVPLWYIGASMMQSLNIRSFFAGILGFCLPYLLLLTCAVYVHQIDIFFVPFVELANFGKMNMFAVMSIPNIITLCFFIILFFISIIHCWLIDYDNKIRTRIILHFIILLNFCILLFIVLQPKYELQLLSLFLPGNCLMTCHFFRRSSSRFSDYFFIIVIVLMILIFVFKMFSLY